MDDLATRVRAAYESADLEALARLLDPDVRWGASEGPNNSDCRNRDQVLSWWSHGRNAGARATVSEIVAGPSALVVGLRVTDTPRASGPNDVVERWQVLTVRRDLITDIRGFDTRDDALARAGLSPTSTP